MKIHAAAAVSFALVAFVISANAYPRSESLHNDDLGDVVKNIDIDTVSESNTDQTDIDLNENSKVSYSGAQLWKVDLDNDVTRYILGGLRDKKEISPWGGDATSLDILVHSKHLTHVEKVLSRSNISFEISIHDIQRAIDTENPLPSDDEDELANRKGHRMTWDAYHRIGDINDYLDYLAITYPSLCTVKTIGSSVKGRQIKVLKVSNGNAGNKAVWIDGGMHAREWISPATVTYIINQFVENYDTETADVKNLDWYFAPVMNPDGYEYSHTNDRLWRKNRARAGKCAGTDLNRNFGYKWGGKGSSKNPCTEIYGGTGPFSEPETAALRDFILSSGANFKAYISFHSYGQYILYPWGYDRVVPPDYADLKNVAQKAAQAMRYIKGTSYKIGPAANTLYPAAGGSDDWAKGSAKIKYAYTIELGDTGQHGFILPSSQIDSSAREGLAAVRVFAAAAMIA